MHTALTTSDLSVGPDTHLVKVLFIGPSACGKTTLIRKLFSDNDTPQSATVGMDFYFKRYLFDGRSVGCSLWDTAGQETFNCVTSSYYRNSQGAVFVYDVTRPETLRSLLDFWMPEFERHCTLPDVVKMIIGNKIDKEQERHVSPQEGAQAARDHGCLYYETSAKLDLNVQDAVVWGLLAQIIDTPSLLRSPGRGPSRTVNVGSGGAGQGHDWRQNIPGWCCLA